MATLTPRYGFTLPAGVEPVLRTVINSNMELVEQYMGNTQDMIAPLYSNENTYSEGNIVIYDNKLYKALEDIDTAEDFDEDKWEETTATQEGSGGGTANVVPNPQGTPTETLNTIGIDDVIYEIEGSGGGGTSEGEGVEIYSENEYIVGKWIDGKKLYQKTYHLSSPITVAGSGAWTSTGIDISDIERLVDTSFSQDVAVWDSINGINDNGILKATILASGSLTVDTITLRYTKTVETDAPAWGGSVNNFGGFIDTDNVIQPFTLIQDTAEHTYTAIEDCIIVYYMASQGDSYIKINNVLISSNYSQYIFAFCNYVEVKKGQIFSFQQSYRESSRSGYTVYGVSYSSSSSGGNSSVDYSTEEKEIGTWIDGSKIYQKTMHYTNLPHNNDWALLDNDFTCDKFISSECLYTIANGQTGIDDGTCRIAYNTPANVNKLSYYTEISGTMSEIYLTVRYTKAVTS